MIKQGIVFVDYESSTAPEREALCRRITEDLGVLTTTIDFFSSALPDLALISKYRVVSLPTFVAVDERGKVVSRFTSIPLSDDLMAVAAGAVK